MVADKEADIQADIQADEKRMRMQIVVILRGSAR